MTMYRRAAAGFLPKRQRSQYTCMACSLSMALESCGIVADEDEVNKVMGAAPMQGASWEQAFAAAQHYGARVTFICPATLNQVKAYTDKGIAVMIAWNPEGRPWSHASVIKDVAEDGTVTVADPNIPDPEETLRVLPKKDFYGKWYEKWDTYLVRRPAMAVEREVDAAGRQMVASVKKRAFEIYVNEKGYAYDDEGNSAFVGLSWRPGTYYGREAMALAHVMDRAQREAPKPKSYADRSNYYKKWAEIAELKGDIRNAEFLRSIATYVYRNGFVTDKQEAVLRRMKAQYETELADPDKAIEALKNPPTPVEAPPLKFPDEKRLILQSLLEAGRLAGPDWRLIKDALGKVNSGVSPTEDELKRLRYLLYRAGMKPSADYFRVAAERPIMRPTRAFQGLVNQAFLDALVRHPTLRSMIHRSGRGWAVTMADLFYDPRYDGGSEYDVYLFPADEPGWWEYNVGMQHGAKMLATLTDLIKPRKMASYSGNPDGKPIYPTEIEHGYDEPLAGGTDVMKRLQNQLLHEQGQDQLVRSVNPIVTKVAAAYLDDDGEYPDEGPDPSVGFEAYMNQHAVKFPKGGDWWIPGRNLGVNMTLVGGINLWVYSILPAFPRKTAYRPATENHPEGIIVQPIWQPHPTWDKDYAATEDTAKKMIELAERSSTVGETVKEEMKWVETFFHVNIPNDIVTRLVLEAPKVAARRWAVDRLRVKNTFIPFDGSKPFPIGTFESFNTRW